MHTRSRSTGRRYFAAALALTLVAALVLAACENPAASSSQSTDDGGSPTAPGPGPNPAPAAALRGGIAVNEILPDPSGATNVDTDGSGAAGTTDEFVELYNAGDTPADVSGLELWDPSSGNWFTLPDGASLDPGATALIVVGVADGGTLPAAASGSLSYDAGHSRGIINNAGDNVLLIDPVAAEYLQLVYNGDAAIDPVADLGADGFPTGARLLGEVTSWGSDIDGSSLARDPDGTGEPAPHVNFAAAASPGEPNTP